MTRLPARWAVTTVTPGSTHFVDEPTVEVPPGVYLRAFTEHVEPVVEIRLDVRFAVDDNGMPIDDQVLTTIVDALNTAATNGG